MNLLTHLRLAHQVHKETRRRTGANIHYLGFLFGNILPDMSLYYLSVPHYMNRSLPFITRKSIDLNDETCDELMYDSFSYAKHLGVISHYVSDYFCFAHTGYYQKSLLHHFLYELLFFFKTHSSLPKMKQLLETNILPNSAKAVEAFIKEHSYKYIRTKHTVTTDISFALFVSTGIASAMVAEAIFNNARACINLFPETGSAHILYEVAQ